MLVSERLMVIEQELQKKSILTLRDMAKRLAVSESTVRRDFDELERSGVLVRVYGGAMKPRDSFTLSEAIEPTMSEKEDYNNDNKRRICARAANLIQDGDCVFIDGGTTFKYLFKFLSGKRINIVTHSILYLREIEDEKAEITVASGRYNSKYGMNVGQLTMDLLKRFSFDYAFIGCVGIDIQNNAISSADIESASIKRLAIKNSIRKCLLADSTKIYVKGIYSFESASTFDTIFMDSFPDNMECPDNLIVCEADA